MKKLLSVLLAGALAVSTSVCALAIGFDEDTTPDYNPVTESDEYNLAKLVHADNDSTYGRAIWNIANRAIVLKEDASKHESGKAGYYPVAGGDYDADGNYVPSGGYDWVEDLNDLTTPGHKIYLSLDAFWLITPGQRYISALDMKDYLKLTVKKGENSKYIKSLKIVDREFDSDDLEFLSDNDATGRDTLPGLHSGAREHDRTYYVEVELKDSIVDKEVPVTFELELKVKKDLDVSNYYYDYYEGFVGSASSTTTQFPTGTVIKAGTKIKIESDKLWINNKVLEGDQDLSAGDHGLMIKPTKNDDNEITWENADDTIARVTFLGDSDPGKFYAKLSTRWDSSIFGEEFKDIEACVYEFTGKPTMTGVARVKLELANPFVNSDGEELVDPDEIKIYQLIDEDTLEDVTGVFTYVENDEGDLMFTAKNRTFGTYVFFADADVIRAQNEANQSMRVPTGIMLSSRA